MYFIPEPVNIDAKVSQNIRSHKNKKESWSFLLPKEPGMAVLDCRQALVSFVAKGMLGICEKKKKKKFVFDLLYCSGIGMEMSFGNMCLKVSW